MKIAVFGNGSVGSRLAALLQSKHEIVFGVRQPGPNQCDISAAAQSGEVLVLAVPFVALAEVAPLIAPAAAGKIVIDATNPLGQNWAPLALPDGRSAAEEWQRAIPGARVVKAFNTVFADNMTPERLRVHDRAISAFVAGDDPSARQAVESIARDAGFAPVDCGGLPIARYLEAMAHLNIQLAATMGNGTNSGFSYFRR